MWKKVLWIIFKYIIYTFLFAILIAFLAKTKNMPAAVPEKYVEKIIEITDKILISLNIIKDENLKAKYFNLSQTTIIKQPLKVSNTTITRNFFSKLINYILFNGYDIQQEKILNKISSEWDKNLKRHLLSLNNLAENPYIKSAILESEAGILDSFTANFLNSIIKDFKMIAAFVIIDKNDKVIKFIKNEDIKMPRKEILKLPSILKKNMLLRTLKGSNYFLYQYITSFAIDKPQYKILFILLPDYFFTIPFEISSLNNLFIFNRNNKIITTKILDKELIRAIEKSIFAGKFSYNGKDYKISYIKLPIIEGFYLGLYYKEYPLWKVIFNIFKILLIMACAVGIVLLMLYIIKEIRVYKKKSKHNELEVVTGAMMEVAKSVKFAADATEKASQYTRLEFENVKKFVKGLKYTSSLAPPEVQQEVKLLQDKEIEEWKLIE